MIDDSSMVTPVSRDEPEPRPELVPSGEAEPSEESLRADLYAQLSMHVTAVVEALPQGARLAVAPVYGPEQPEQARALTDLIATLAHRNGAALIHPTLALAAYVDFGFAPQETQQPRRLYDYAQQIGAEFVVVPRVPHWQTQQADENDNHGNSNAAEQDVFELHVYDVAAQTKHEEATRRVSLPLDSLAPPRSAHADAMLPVHRITLELAQLMALGLEVALLVRDSFAATPRQVSLGEPLQEGDYLKLFVRATQDVRLFAAGVWEDGALLPLSGDAVTWGSGRADEDEAETLGRYETALAGDELLEMPEASWIRLERSGRLTLVLEARLEVEDTRWFVPQGSRAFVGTRPVLWLREQETRERMARTLERQQAAITRPETPPQQEEDATDWSAVWRRTAADRRRELVVWANAIARLIEAEEKEKQEEPSSDDASSNSYRSRVPHPLPYAASPTRQEQLAKGQRFRLAGENELTLELPTGEILETLRLPAWQSEPMHLQPDQLVLHRNPRHGGNAAPEQLTVEPHQAAGLRGAVAILTFDVE